MDQCKPLDDGGAHAVSGDAGRVPGRQGRAVQVDPMKSMLKLPGTRHLKLKCDELL